MSSNTWFSLCWYRFEPGQGSYLFNNGEEIRTNNRIWYYYAETYGSTCETYWAGDGSVGEYCSGEYLNFKKKSYVDDDGDLYAALTCNVLQYSDRRELEGDNATDTSGMMYDEPPEEYSAEDLIFKREHQDEVNPDCAPTHDVEEMPWFCDGTSHFVQDDDGDAWGDDEEDGADD
jgi:hypothetical protein